MILDRVLAATGHQNDVVDARRDRFLDAVLNNRLVDERQHLLGLRFGGRQESGSKSCSGKYRLADNAAQNVRPPESSAASYLKNVRFRESATLRYTMNGCSMRLSCAITWRTCGPLCETADWNPT